VTRWLTCCLAVNGDVWRWRGCCCQHLISCCWTRWGELHEHSRQCRHTTAALATIASVGARVCMCMQELSARFGLLARHNFGHCKLVRGISFWRKTRPTRWLPVAVPKCAGVVPGSSLQLTMLPLHVLLLPLLLWTPSCAPPQPTNHLDAESVAWLERFLGEFKGTVVAVTHDRWGLLASLTRPAAASSKPP
jgi:hypothetical protein